MADGTGLDKDQSPLLYDLRRVGTGFLLCSASTGITKSFATFANVVSVLEGWAWAVQPNMKAASGTINTPSVSLCLSTTIQSPLFFVTIDREFLTGHEIQRPIRHAVFLPAGWLALAVARGWNDLLRPPKTRRLHTPGANPTTFPQPPHAALRARTPCSSLKNVSLERVGP